MSVPSTSEAQATFAATLVDEWVRHGLREVVVGPGSRSTPLALAVAARTELTVHVRIDERSAGFFAIGCAKRTGAPTLIVVTSGTAATELHAAVAEASHGLVPLLVATADRPPELHNVGAPQTTRQRELYGPLVRAFSDPGVARDEARASWRPLAARLYEAAVGEPLGPAHLNVPFVEPLVAAAGSLPEGRSGGAPWVRRGATTRAASEVDDTRVLVVAGAGASADLLTTASRAGWPILGDATCATSLPHFDAVLRADEVAAALAPTTVIRCGGLPASKVLQRRLREWPCHVVAVGPDVADPDGIVATEIDAVSLRAPTRSSEAWLSRWRGATDVVAQVAAYLDGPDQPVTEPGVARALVALSVETATPLVVGSSMPVRDVEWWAPRGARVLANRGLNGIDGVTSTFCGVAAGSRAIGLVGDVTFLHDVSALVDGLGPAGGRACLVVADNGGGGIFSFLPQAAEVDPDRFRTLFLTPRNHAAEELARAFGHRGARAKTNGELRDAVSDALDADGLTVVVAVVPDTAENVTLHDELNELAGRALAAWLK